jgi:MULE transposase domain
VLTAKEYYNLCRKADTGGKLTNQQKIQVICKYLEDQDFHVQVWYEHLLDEQGERTGWRVVQDIFFISDAQISLGRRFASDFLYKMDATFNTNTLRLPLSVMVGITNTRKTFPLAYCYITSESAKSFDFVAGELTKYVFYDCPEAAVICADFTKGLGASIAARALRDAREEDEAIQQRRLEAGELPDVSALRLGSREEETILQLCEWHAAKAIQRRLVHARKYSKERREGLINLVNA